MVALKEIVAAFAVAIATVFAIGDTAAAGEPQNPEFLLFSGTDLWRYGDFLYGGLLWSPAGLNKDGFTLKMLLDGGRYTYTSGALARDIDGATMSVAAMPGWRVTDNGLTVSVFAGPVLQGFRLVPSDPGSRLHGFYAGIEAAADIWYQPSARMMAALNGAIGSIGPTGYVRAAFGARLFPSAFVGPEIGEFWSGDFDELEVGAQMTGLRVRTLEWSLGTGLALTSDQRYGPYLRLGVDTRD